MKIDRNNYEEYFILYLDNELSAAERFEVETFAKAHPDLQEELDILLQSKLVPDQHIIFENKEELLSFSNDTTISLSNYEEWFVLYMDNELTAEQRTVVEQFTAANPEIQTDLQLLLQTKSEPEQSIVFPDKETLYRREEKTRPIIWWRIAAAAAVLIAVATTAIVFVNKKSGTTKPGSEPIVSGKPAINTTPQENIPATNNNSITAPVIQNNVAKENTVVKEEKPLQKILPEQTVIASVTKKDERTKKEAVTVTTVKKNEPVISDNAPRQMIDNDAVAAINTDKVNTTIDAATQPRLTNSKEIIETSSVTPRTVQPLYASTPVDTEMPDQSTGKKSKLRGFLRKVTRTFEKKTNIDATDDDDRLLIGGLALRLK
jgi:hypothetical protein